MYLLYRRFLVWYCVHFVCVCVRALGIAYIMSMFGLMFCVFACV